MRQIADQRHHTLPAVFVNQGRQSFSDSHPLEFVLSGRRVLRRWNGAKLPNTREIVVVLDGLKFSQSWAV
jgi:hypothetical protein